MATIRDIAASPSRGTQYRDHEFADLALADPNVNPLERALAERLLRHRGPPVFDHLANPKENTL